MFFRSRSRKFQVHCRTMRFRGWMFFVSVWMVRAEQGVLVVHVKDLHDHPIENVRFRAGDTSVSAPTAKQSPQRSTATSRTATDSFGEARIRLGAQTKPNDVILLEIVGYPKDKDLVFISPWDKWTRVPPFENDSQNFVPVTLAERGDRACLENTTCIRAAVAQINKENAPRAAREPPRSSEEQGKEALATVAKQFGLTPKEIDQAIRA